MEAAREHPTAVAAEAADAWQAAAAVAVDAWQAVAAAAAS